MEPLSLLAVASVFVLAGAVKGITGMGLPTVAISLLGLWMAPAQAAALLVAPSLATNIAQCIGPQWRALAKRLWPMWLALMLATLFAPRWGDWVPGLDARRALGLVLVVYGGWGLWGHFRPQRLVPQASSTASDPLPGQDPGASSLWTRLFVGAGTGFLAAVTAVFVMPLVPWLQRQGLGKEGLVQALGLSFSLATLALGWRLHNQDHLQLWSAPSGVALLAAFAGLWVGARIRRRISLVVFQRSLFIVFIALGLTALLIQR